MECLWLDCLDSDRMTASWECWAAAASHSCQHPFQIRSWEHTDVHSSTTACGRPQILVLSAQLMQLPKYLPTPKQDEALVLAPQAKGHEKKKNRGPQPSRRMIHLTFCRLPR